MDKKSIENVYVTNLWQAIILTNGDSYMRQ